MAIGVYITYRILDVADLTVDGSIATGGAVAAVLIIGGCNVWVAMVAAFLVGMLAGLATGIFHTFMGIPAILAGILTQLSLYSINLRILGGKANMAVSVNNYPLLVSARNARVLSLSNPIFILAALAVAVAPCAQPAQMPTWRARRASTPTRIRCSASCSPTASSPSPARC